jgi:hypothetical protein
VKLSQMSENFSMLLFILLHPRRLVLRLKLVRSTVPFGSRDRVYHEKSAESYDDKI